LLERLAQRQGVALTHVSRVGRLRLLATVPFRPWRWCDIYCRDAYGKTFEVGSIRRPVCRQRQELDATDVSGRELVDVL
jgi:hypothetical protein